ncbi:MAG TPA: hypothetical protein DCG75_06395, partial [Bacteroidales bacterium]|nr:hypothetical protein [Bacteroidales bacterium]
MFSKDEAKLIRQKFWVNFDEYSKKRWRKSRKRSSWILQKTGIKGFNLKFDVNDKSAQVGFEIASKGVQRQLKYQEKMQSLKALLDQEFDHQLIWSDYLQLENGKNISRIYIEKPNLNIFKED